MSPSHRLLGTILLLMVVVGHALGSVHAATHLDADLGECALCATYGNASAAVVDTGSVSVPAAFPGVHVDSTQLAYTVAPVLCNHQRGPPLSRSG